MVVMPSPAFFLDSIGRCRRFITAKNAPKFAVAVLAVLLAAQVLLIVAVVFRPGGPQHSSQSPLTEITPDFARRSSDLIAQTIVAAHLFGASTLAATADPEAVTTRASLSLRGVIAAQSPADGFAIIAEAGATARVLAVGAEIGGAILRSVYPERVLLERNGLPEVLFLPRGGGSRGPLFGLDGAAASGDGTDPGAVVADSHPATPHTLLDGQLQWTPAYNPATGGLMGYRIAGTRGDERMKQLGFKPGDVATIINGVGLDSVENGEAMLELLNSRDTSVNVTVRRRGEYVDIQLRDGA